MYDIDFSNIKKQISFNIKFLIIIIFFILMLIFAIFRPNIKRLIKSYDKKTYAYKVDINQSLDSEGNKYYIPVYYYEVKNKKYVCESSNGESDTPREGENIVYYKSDNPNICMTEYESKNRNTGVLTIFILTFVFVLIYFINRILKLNKMIKSLKKLNMTGKLIKGIPYKLIDTKIVANGRKIYAPVISLTNTDGKTIELVGNPRFDYITSDKDNLVDLVIDLNGSKNYYIDFEINRLNGITNEDDYYHEGMILNNIDDSFCHCSYVKDRENQMKFEKMEECLAAVIGKFSLIPKIIGTIILILVILFNLSFLKEKNIYKDYKTTEGTVDEVKNCLKDDEKFCDYVYLYNVNGKKYKITDRSSFDRVEVKIYYDVDNPKKAVIASSNSITFNIIIILICLVTIYKINRKKN